jgi:nucleotide-binding universal stress UspA family protein
MTKKILIALDGSEAAWRAVEYVGKHFGRVPRVKVTLLHVLPDLPPLFWDIGHFLSRQEQKARKSLIDQWEKEHEARWTELIEKAKRHLVRAGVSAGAIRRTFKPDYGDVATEIIEEAVKGRYSAIVMGRTGRAKDRTPRLGSVTNKVLRHASGFQVIVVN